MLLLNSCQETDVEAPTVCTADGTAFSVLSDEIEAVAGTTVTLEDVFCDNSEFSEVRWDVHNAADHAHEEVESNEGLILHSGEEWEVLQIQPLSGTALASSFTFDIPFSARGVWDVVVSVVDAEGNAAVDVVTPLHIENAFIPEFSFSQVGSTDPINWEGEPTWSAGASVPLMGTVSDSDGLSVASLALVQESNEEVLWSMDLAVDGAVEFPFQIQVMVPEGTAGECHLELEAVDALGNAMETGFHLEVE